MTVAAVIFGGLIQTPIRQEDFTEIRVFKRRSVANRNLRHKSVKELIYSDKSNGILSVAFKLTSIELQQER